jgi:hypothetical protein
MKTIHKYVLEADDQVTVQAPIGRRPLTVAVQRGKLCVWALVDTDQPMEPWKFRVLGTGHPFDDFDPLTHEYLGTVLIHNDSLVFHVYQVEPL